MQMKVQGKETTMTCGADDDNPNLREGERRTQLVNLLLYFWEVFSWDGRIGNTDVL